MGNNTDGHYDRFMKVYGVIRKEWNESDHKSFLEAMEILGDNDFESILEFFEHKNRSIILR